MSRYLVDEPASRRITQCAIGVLGEREASCCPNWRSWA